jgi:hypothetical protein
VSEGLRPTKVTVHSEQKFFGLERGSSEGSNVTIEFDTSAIPDLDMVTLAKLIFKEKRRLDLMVLNMEYLRGSVDDSSYLTRRNRIREMYAKTFPEDKEPE